MDEVWCPRCGAKIRSLAKLEEQARDLVEQLGELSAADRRVRAKRLADRIACHARTCQSTFHQSKWKIHSWRM